VEQDFGPMRLYFGRGFYEQGFNNSMNEAGCSKWFFISKTIKSFNETSWKTIWKISTKLNKIKKKAKQRQKVSFCGI